MKVYLTTIVWPVWQYLLPLFQLKDEEIFDAGRHILKHTYNFDHQFTTSLFDR
jgi:hypothetical protein